MKVPRLLLAAVVWLLVGLAAVAQPFNDNFEKRTPFTGTNAMLVGTFAGATAEPGEPWSQVFERTLWWSWHAPADGLVQVAPPPDSSAFVAAYLGDVLINLSVIAANTGPFTWFAESGVSYAFQVAGLQSQSNSFVAEMKFVPRPVNLSAATSTVLAGTNVLATGCVDGMPAQPKSLWWQWTSPGYGNVTMDTLFSSMSVALGVFEGSPTNLVSVSTQYPVPNPSSFFVTPGRNFFISTTGGNNSGTNLHVLRIVMPSLTVAPVNDLFANATRISGTELNVAERW